MRGRVWEGVRVPTYTQSGAHPHARTHTQAHTHRETQAAHTTNGTQTDKQKQRRKRQMTNMDALLILGIVAFLAMYAAWMWDEVKKAIPNPYDSEESQNKGAQAHEMTSDEEIPSNETKTQQEAGK
nr:MAG TPA: hypothetical protein [Caudoviricetes sp.]